MTPSLRLNALLCCLLLCSVAERALADPQAPELTTEMQAAMQKSGPETPLAWLGNAIKYHYETDPLSIETGVRYRLPEARKRCAGKDKAACATAGDIEKWLVWAKAQAWGKCDKSPCEQVPEALVPASLKGKVWVLHAWASWCPYCRMDHQRIGEMAAEKKFRGRFVSVVYQDTDSAAAAYLAAHGNPYAASASAPRELLDALNLRKVPATYVIGPRGNVISRIKGELGASGQEVLEKLQLD